MLGVGYGIAVLSAAIGAGFADEQTRVDGATCLKGTGWSLIPLGGPFLTLDNYPDHNVVGYSASGPTVRDCDGSRHLITALVVVDEVLQLGGAALLTLGIVLRATGPGPESTSSRLELLPYAPGATAGLTLRLTSF